MAYSKLDQSITVRFNVTGDAADVINANFAWTNAFFGGVNSRTPNTPASPSEGDFYIISGPPTGQWSADGAATGDLALRFDSDWLYLTPPTLGGIRLYVKDEYNTYICNGTDWIPFYGSEIELLPTNVESLTAVTGERNNHAIILFDDTTKEEANFKSFMPNVYNSNGLTIDIYWTSASTSGSVVWDASFEAIKITDATDTDDFSTPITSNVVSAPAFEGEIRKSTITLTDGIQIDSLGSGNAFRVKIARDPANGSDTMTGDAEFVAGIIYETEV